MQVIFDFVGGPRDGERLVGSVDDGVPTEAGGFFQQTERGRVGAQFWCTCEYSVNALRTIPWIEIEMLESAGYRFRGHVYQIAERTDEPDTVLARARHLFAAE